MSIPFNLQYFVENELNDRYAWMLTGIAAAIWIGYGLLMYWLQKYCRQKSRRGIVYRAYLHIQRLWYSFNGCIRLEVPLKRDPLYFQPSLVLLLFIYIIVNMRLCYVGTEKIDYEPRYYIVGKRVGKISLGNLPVLLVLITKNDVVAWLTGFSADKINLLHRWMGRCMWLMFVAHFCLTITYWVRVGFPGMITIPPQIFGMIGFGMMTICTWLSMRFMRKWSYEFFLFNHGFAAGFGLLMVFFHSLGPGKAHILFAVHLVALDRVWAQMGRSLINKYISPTKCRAKVTTIEDAVVVNIPMEKKKWKFFSWGSWKAGQHYYLRVGRVRRIQWHPFTVASVASSGNIKMVIRKRGGFTKALFTQVSKERQKQNLGDDCEVEMKVMVHGPYGARIQPLLSFDSVLFISGGSGGSFTFPLAIDLLQNIAERNASQDFVGRPTEARVTFIWYCRTENHIEWYRDELNLLEELSQDLNVQIRVLVTRKSEVQLDREDSNSSKKRIADETTIIKRSPSSSSTPRMSIEYEKIPTDEIVNNEVDVLIGGGMSKSLAVMGCGPLAMLETIEYQCQQNRWRSGAPDIYSFMEKYVV